MNVEAGWLLRNHKYIVSRRRFLETLLKDSEKMMSVDEKDVIDVITYMRRVRQTSAKGVGTGSRTEYAAVNLGELTEDQIRGCKEAVTKWTAELRALERLESVREAILCGLTEEEQALIKKHFDEKISLASLAEAPLCAGLPQKSQSTLKRMLRTIERKAENITSMKTG